MGKREREDKLFSKWEAARKDQNGFIRDGVVCEAAYENSDLKIVVVLKEPNAPGESGWELRDSMTGEKGWRIWNNVARWVYGIRHRTQIPSWADLEKETGDFVEFRKKWLESICAMNLKKVPGSGAVDYGVLSTVAENNESFIQEQYGIYNPDLTICCGGDSGSTGDMFRDAIGHTDEKNRWEQTKRGTWWYEREEKKKVVIFNHPSSRTKDSFMFYGLVDAVNEIYDGAG